MTRDVMSQGYKICYAARKNSAGVVTTVYRDAVIPYEASNWRRPDVVRNPKDDAGWRKPSPYHSYIRSSDAGYMDIEWTVPGDGVSYENVGGISPNVSGPIGSLVLTDAIAEMFYPSNTLVNQAIIRARNNVADRVASFGESLAEMRETVETLGTLATKLDRFLQASAKKNWRGAALALGVKPASRKARRARDKVRESGETMGAAWLSYNFGIAPIIDDMVAIAIAMGVGKPLRATGTTVLMNTNETKQFRMDLGVSYGVIQPTVSCAVDQEIKSGVHVRLDYEVSIDALRELTSYGLMDAPATVWAVLPSSFLLDFVLPVSEVLRSLTATFGLSFKGGSQTKFSFVKRAFSDYVAVPNASFGSQLVRFNCAILPMQCHKVDRTIFKSDPNPVDLWLKNPLDVFKTLTVMSLLATRLSKHFKPTTK